MAVTLTTQISIAINKYKQLYSGAIDKVFNLYLDSINKKMKDLDRRIENGNQIGKLDQRIFDR